MAAAKEDPKKFGHLKEEMDRTGKIDNRSANHATTGDNVTGYEQPSGRRGNSSPYLYRKLKNATTDKEKFTKEQRKQASKALARFHAGELSIHRAAVEAGIRGAPQSFKLTLSA